MKSFCWLAALTSVVLYGICTAQDAGDKTKSQTPAPSAKQAPGKEQAQEDPESKARPLQKFMRAKLSASTKILEGLAMEDLDLIREGAVEMNQMSQAEQWRRHEDMLYRQFSADFRQTTSDLIDATKEHQFDRAALKWMDATMACIECHRYVRNKLVVDRVSLKP
jgi:hypothetical protein